MTTNGIRISAVMGVYNCERYLDEAVGSIVAQTYPHWELIVVDDGSTDQTASRAEEWATRDARIHVVRARHAGFAGAPRNIGLKLVRGDIISVIDGDDITHPERFARVASIFEREHDADIVYHDYVRFEAGTPSFLEEPVQRTTNYVERALQFGAIRRRSSGVYESTDLFAAFLAATGTGMLQGNLAFRRELLPSLGERPYREDMRTFNDVEFYHRLVPRRKLIFFDEVLFAYRRTAGSLLNTVREAHMVEAIYSVKSPALKHAERSLTPHDLERVREVLAEGWRSIGWRASRARRIRIAASCYAQALRLTGDYFRQADAIFEMARLLPQLLWRNWFWSSRSPQ